MDYLVGATRIQLIRLKHLEAGTRVQATERVPSGACHAVEANDGPDKALCGAEVVEVLEQSFRDTEFTKCGECEALVASS